MRILIAGEIPFIDEVERLCRRAGHDVRVYLVEDILGAMEAEEDMDHLSNVEIAIELHNESAATKQELLSALSAGVPADALILTSALVTGATQAAAWTSHPERVVGFAVLPLMFSAAVFTHPTGSLPLLCSCSPPTAAPASASDPV